MAGEEHLHDLGAPKDPIVDYLQNKRDPLTKERVISDDKVRIYVDLINNPEKITLTQLLDHGINLGAFFNNFAMKLSRQGGILSSVRSNDEKPSLNTNYLDYISENYKNNTRNQIYQDFAESFAETLEAFADRDISKLSTVDPNHPQDSTAIGPDVHSDLIEKLRNALSLKPGDSEPEELDKEAIAFVTEVYKKLREKGYTHYDLWN